MSTLTPDPQNARAHDERNITVIMESLRRYGQQTPLVVREGVILKGNATYEAAKRLGWSEIAAIPFDKAKSLVAGYKLVDNRSAELATWGPMLEPELEKLLASGEDLSLLGWSEEDMEALEDSPERLESDATLLNSLGFIAGEPKTKVSHGQVIDLGDHRLIVVDPVRDLGLWKTHLTDGDLFCPYPGPYIALAMAGKKQRMVLVQPDPFIAGYIVDRFNEMVQHD